MYVRHGSPFTDRLIFHDMFNRASAHCVHDTNEAEGDDTSLRFYVWQLGLGMRFFLLDRPRPSRPHMVVSGEDPSGKRRGAGGYLRPLCPSGSCLPSPSSRSWERSSITTFPGRAGSGHAHRGRPGRHVGLGVRSRRFRSLPVYLAGVGTGVTMMILGVARMQPGSIFGSKADSGLANPTVALGLGLIGLGSRDRLCSRSEDARQGSGFPRALRRRRDGSPVAHACGGSRDGRRPSPRRHP